MSDLVELERDGVSLVCRDFGGDGPPVLLLHGLAGHSGEWGQTASWLRRECRVWALDARGHGASQRRPPDVSPSAQVADVSFVIQRLRLAPVVLVGQSLGGVTGLLVAARHPEQVRALALADASPVDAGADYLEAVADLQRSLDSWPVPFPSRAQAERYFAERFGGPVVARAWVDGLDQRDDGWWPRFEPAVMVATLRGYLATSSFADWDRVRCPTLLVRAGHGVVAAATVREMQARQPGLRVVTLRGAAHDLHLDRPDQWQRALRRFVSSLPPGLPGTPGGQ